MLVFEGSLPQIYTVTNHRDYEWRVRVGRPFGARRRSPVRGSALACVYYCRTYYKAVRGGGRRRVDDMCYDRRRGLCG